MHDHGDRNIATIPATRQAVDKLIQNGVWTIGIHPDDACRGLLARVEIRRSDSR